MNDFFNKYSGALAPLFLRLGLAAVFLLFGYQKLSTPSVGTSEIQLALGSDDKPFGIGPSSALNYYLGLFEVIIAISFLLGTYLRVTAFAAAIMVTGFFIGLVLKYGFSQDPQLNRDVGLIGAALALWLIGPGPWSFDAWLAQRKEQKEKERLTPDS